MNFREATDLLFVGTNHSQLASSLDVSVATIRQARLAPAARAYRAAPPEWAFGVRDLAVSEIKRLEHLIEMLDAQTGRVSPLARLGEAGASTSAESLPSIGPNRARKPAGAVWGGK